MTYEIRVVFQSAEAYQSAVEGLYKAFGVEIDDDGMGRPGRPGDRTIDDASDPVLTAPTLSLDHYLAEDPESLSNNGYSFTVEGQTHW